MRIVKRVLSTYSADNFGVCSALYELGGLVVMHDASGCNSTYNTHDEPRWYDMDSLVFISGLTEKNAIFGNDDKLINDLVTAAEEFRPNFIAVCGGPLPHIIGTDFRAVAKAVERRCGIPSFGFQTNGMDSYISGAGQALEALVSLMGSNGSDMQGSPHERREPGSTLGLTGKLGPENQSLSLKRKRRKPGRTSVSILGATPLDFSLNGSVKALRVLLEKAGFKVQSVWAMGDDFECILRSADADVNLVVSAVGLRAAIAMEERFGIPYVMGLPAGRKVTERIITELGRKAGALRNAEESRADRRDLNAGGKRIDSPNNAESRDRTAGQYPGDVQGGTCGSGDIGIARPDILIIGEPVQSLSIKETLFSMYPDKCIRIVSPMHGLPKEFIALGCEKLETEDALREVCREAGLVIADPLYARLLPDEADKFVSLPHAAYSGRYYEDEVPVLIGNALDVWIAQKVEKDPSLHSG